MTKQHALKQFRDMWTVALDHNPKLRGDSIAKREEWNNYTDYLCKSGHITEHQYDTWDNPF